MNPEVSVVMGVRNGASSLENTIRSILMQSFSNLEFLVVDDGSTDGTPEILARFAGGDARLRIVTQAGGGLTRALKRGCAECRGKYIARQDAGDVSLPGRLADLAVAMDADESVGFACGSTELFAPEGEVLSILSSAGADGRFGVLDRIAPGGPGPSHHGAAMFRRELYQKVGGYRTEFRMAQDWDLWFRMIEHAGFLALEHVQYRARVDPYGLSMSDKALQDHFGRLAFECHQLRMSGRDESPALDAARALSARPPRTGNSGPGFYFIASLLAKRKDPRARGYFLRAALARPHNIKAWLRWAVGR